MVQEQPLFDNSHTGNASNASAAGQGEEMSIVVVADSAESPTASTQLVDNTQSVHIKLQAIFQEKDSSPIRDEEAVTDHESGLPAVNIRQQKQSYLKIQKVPQILKDIALVSYKTCYDPLVISLGPFHYGKARYKYMQDLKVLIARQFIAETDCAPSDILRKFHQIAQRARHEYYIFDQHEKKPNMSDDDPNMSDDDLVHILFTDACFLVQFILSHLETNEKMKVKMKVYEVAFVIRDMFLLENQLPFPLVKSLMELRFEEHEIRQKIKKFIDLVRFTPVPQPPQALFAKKLWKLLCGTNEKALPSSGGWDLQNDPLHLLHALQIRLVDQKKLVQKKSNMPDDNATLYSYRSVSELVAAGVNFKAGKSWCQFTDIWFQEKAFRSPVLIMPPIIVDDSTPAMFLNLVAFEALPDAPEDLGVTSFLWFMDSLVDTADDVKELRSKGILVNFLGSDEQVAQMFNSITDQLVPNMDAYARVKAGIEGHFRSSWRVSWAQWLHAHFSTPWSGIASIVAIVAVGLSFVQAYFSVFPRCSSGS